MRISPIFLHNKNNIRNFHNKKIASTPSFQANMAKSDILKAGYIPVSIQNLGLQGKSDKIIIDSADKFIALTNSPNMWNKKIILSDDIDLKGATIKPIGNATRAFSGEFNGNGCKIRNFKIVAAGDSYNIGLFGKCQDAQISNIDVENAYISGGQQIGGIAGWAKNCKFKNCFFQGFIEGEKNIGGLIGASRNNEIKNSGTTCTIQASSDEEEDLFDFDFKTNSSGSAGGLIGSDDSSEISGCYSKSTLKGEEQIGGFIGYSTKSTIKDSSFEGIITGNKKVGSIVGWAENTNVLNSYSLANIQNFFGLGINNTVCRSYNSLDEIISTPEYYWDKYLWHKSYEKLPRLKIKENRMSAKELFLEDINNDIKTGRITNKAEHILDGDVCKINLAPPEHFDINNEMLNKIKNCSDRYTLFKLFGEVVLEIERKQYNNQDIKERYSEVLLELVKNPYMNLNKRYRKDYNTSCTPLFILVCLNEAYVLQEALKCDDVDVSVCSGWDNNLLPLDQAIKHHIDACTYVFLNEPKMTEFIKPRLNEFKSMDLSAFARVLFESYPDLPKYNAAKGGIEFDIRDKVPPEMLEVLKEISSLEDVLKTIEIDPNYCDSNGNNIANIAVNLSDEEDEEGLRTIIAADKIGVNLELVNDKSESPYGHALYRQKGHIAAYLIFNTKNPYLRTNDGTDAMLLFSTMPEENYSINYMEIARQKGLSINSQANDGTTPLINAVDLKHHDAIKYLLFHGANPNICDAFNQTALHKACVNNDEEAINMLLDAYAYPDITDCSGLKPFEYLNSDLKEKLKEKFENLSYFYKIAQCDDIVQSDTLIHNADSYSEIQDDEFYEKLYQLLCSDPNEAMLQLSKNIILNPNLKTEPDSEGNNILHLIAGVKSPYAKECIKLALDKGYDVNKQNEYGETPLIRALDAYLCANTTEEKIALLQNIKAILDSNPNVDLCDNNKQGALHRVCQSGNPLLLIELLRLNPKINQIDSQNYTPFDYIPANTDNPIRQIINKYLKDNNVIRRV